MIQLRINGKKVELEGSMPLLDYITRLGVNPRAVAVELNGVILERETYARTDLNRGDVVEIVRMVGGGQTMPAPWTIRSAETADRQAILRVVENAFSRRGRDGHEEVQIVLDTWARCTEGYGLELVAVDEGSVIGHVLGARGDLAGRNAIGVAPLSVAPLYQGEGIGSALMTELIRRAEAARWPLLALLGSPAYYGRFGFEPAGQLGIVYKPAGADNPDFQVRRLNSFDPSLRGEFTYCWEAATR